MLGIIVVFVVVGLALYLINLLIPMEPSIKSALNAVVLVILILWVIFQIFNGTGVLRVPLVR